MEITGTEIEARVLYLEEQLQKALRRLNALADKAKAAAEQQSPLGGAGSGSIYWGQVITSDIAAASGGTFTSGTVRLQTVISGKLYNKTDGTAGHYTDETVSGLAYAAIVVKTYIQYHMVNGVLTFFYGTCTPSATFSADDITA